MLALGQYRPGGQSIQSVSAVFPSSVLYVPEGQLVRVVPS